MYNFLSPVRESNSNSNSNSNIMSRPWYRHHAHVSSNMCIVCTMGNFGSVDKLANALHETGLPFDDRYGKRPSEILVKVVKMTVGKRRQVTV